MSDWPKYLSHKVVQAAKIVSIHDDGPDGAKFLWVDPGTGTLEKFEPTVAGMFEKAEVGGYVVLYEDGFKSVSPQGVFEDGYKLIVT